MAASTLKSEQINLRANPSQRDLLDRAAKMLHKSRTEFMLDAATSAAREILLDSSEFVLDEAEYTAFVEILDRSVIENTALMKLLNKQPSWER
jgi:uncharacterized protein (DUF1778 family)